MLGIELLAALVFSQYAQSWDCDEVSGAMSQMIACGADEVHAARVQLNEYLDAARAETFVAGDGSGESAYLEASQSAWEAYADIQCRADAARHSGGMIETISFQGCLREMTRERTQAIWHLYLRGNEVRPPVLPEPTLTSD